MLKEEFLNLSDDEKWDFVAMLYNEIVKLNGSQFNETDVVENLQGILIRKLSKYEMLRVKSFFTYARKYNFKWKDGSDMELLDVVIYLFNGINKKNETREVNNGK